MEEDAAAVKSTPLDILERRRVMEWRRRRR